MRSSRRFRYDIASIVSPFLAFAIVYLYHQFCHSDFWGSIDLADDAGRAAGAMMACAEVMQLDSGISIGSVTGLTLAIFWVSERNARRGAGIIGLLFNGVVFLLLLFRLTGF
jgi:hypothetical protein